MSNSPRRQRWSLLGALIGVYFSFGVIVTSISPMLSVVQDDIGASRSEMGFVLGAWALLFIGTAPLAGRIIDRYGLRLSILAGGLSISLSALARAGASGVGSLWLAIAVFGLGGPLISAGAPTLVRNLFDDSVERRRAVSAYAIAPSMGSVLTLALTNSVLLPVLGHWRTVLVAEAALAALATVGWLVVSGSIGSLPTKADRAPESAGEPTDGRQVRQLLSSSGVRFALAVSFPIFFMNHALNNWFPTLLAELADLSLGASSNWVAISRFVGIGAAILVPNIATAANRGLLLSGVCLVLSVGLLLLGFGGPSAAIVAALVIGIRGAMVPIGAIILMEANGVTTYNAGLANGLWFALGEVGGVTGPFSSGLIADTSLGFQGVVVALSAVAGLTAALTVLATTRKA